MKLVCHKLNQLNNQNAVNKKEDSNQPCLGSPLGVVYVTYSLTYKQWDFLQQLYSYQFTLFYSVYRRSGLERMLFYLQYMNIA